MINMSGLLASPYDWVRKYGRDIRVHGNGFVQIDLPDDHRMHLWGHPDVPRQHQSTPIHDHAWDMQSMVLRGRIVNVIWRPQSLISGADNLHDVYTPVPRAGQDTALEPTGQSFWLSVDKMELVQAGQMYAMRAGELHETWLSCPAVTVIKKITPERGQWDRPVRVLCPVGQRPDNNFTRYDISTDRLWTIAEEMLQ